MRRIESLNTFYAIFMLQFIARPLSLRGVNGECNVCSVGNNAACVSETQFEICDNGVPNPPVNQCPEGYVCSNVDREVCKPRTANPYIACGGCNKCDPTLTFACTGVNTFALCLGTETISTITGTCVDNLVCNVNNGNICGSGEEGIAPTCPTALEPSETTPAPPSAINDPAAYCQTVMQKGRFPVGTDPETTCKQYVSCFIYNDVWSGQLYMCPGSTYFNSATRMCEKEMPATCSGHIQSRMMISGTRLLY